jgi:hypothetical protein
LAAIVSVSMLLLFWVFGCNFWTVLLSSWIFVSLLLLPFDSVKSEWFYTKNLDRKNEVYTGR